MSADRDTELVLDRWLADGPTEVADRVIDRALDIVNHTSQRRRVTAPRRYVPMSSASRLAAAAAIIVLAGAGVLFVAGSYGNSPGVGGPPASAPASPTPGASASPSPSASAAAGASPTGVDSAFANRATTICAATRLAASSYPPFPYPSFDPWTVTPASDLPGVGANFAQYGSSLWTSALDQQRALGAPATGRQAWDAYMSDLTAFVAEQKQQVQAAQAGDAATFVATVSWLSSHRQELDNAAVAAGVGSCAI